MKTEVGIPVYNALETLPATLVSLLGQTIHDFSICLSIDGDGHLNEYLDIVNKYKNEGLNIRVLYTDINNGPGIARQKILDTTEAEYIIFLDADDLLTPRAVEILTYVIETQNLNIVRAAYVREEIGKVGLMVPQNSSSITHFHGKIYRVSYLQENNISFLPELRYNEDSYFNLVAWNSTEARGEVAEPMCIWRENLQSITRIEGEKSFFIKSYDQYIYSQVEGLKKIHSIKKESSDKLITATLILLYNNYMRAKLYQLSTDKIEEYLNTFRQCDFIQEYLNNYYNWVEVIKELHAGEVYDDVIIFYKEPFNEWANRLLKQSQ